jgi:lipopolysaccharide export system permease protein
MRFPRILSFYVVREVLQYAVLGLLGVGSILLTQNMLRQISDFASFGLETGDILTIVGALVATLSAYAVPVAFLFGVLVAVGRLSSDSELTAMRALGVSLAQFATPFVVLAFGVSLLTWWLMSEVEPSARQQLRQVAANVATRGALVEPGVFRRLDRTGERLLFVDERDDADALHGILISDRTQQQHPFLVVAERGRFHFDESAERAHLLLEAGDIHFEPADADSPTYRRIAFATFDYSFDMAGLLGVGPCSIPPKEMSSGRIRQILAHFEAHDGKPPECTKVKTSELYEIQHHRRMALPFAPLLFALLGISLGMRRSRGARSWAMLLCIVLVFSYYALLSFGTFLASEEALPASIALWLPNVVFGATSIPLLARARRSEL